MEYVLNISISNKHRLYPFSGMQNQPIIIDEIDGTAENPPPRIAHMTRAIGSSMRWCGLSQV